MTRDEITRMAREAGFIRVMQVYEDGSEIVTIAPIEELTRFAALVAEHEREQCAKVCESLKPSMRTYDHRFWDACHESAAAIRSRT